MYSSKEFFTNIKPEMGASQSLELETLVKDSSVNAYETLVFQSIVNEGKASMVLILIYHSFNLPINNMLITFSMLGLKRLVKKITKLLRW